MRSAMPPAPLLLLPLFLVVSMSRTSAAAALEETWLQRMQSDVTPTSSSRILHLAETPDVAAPHSWHVQQRRDVNQVMPGKRNSLGINARGFHEDVFHRDYGSFSPMRTRRNVELSRDKRSVAQLTSPSEQMIGKRRPEMDAAGFYGDTFSNGLGEFWPLKKRWAPVKTNNDAWRRWYKRKPEMDSSGFFGDTFSNGFGDFYTMKKKNGQEIYKRRPEMDSAGFYGDTFSNGFGDFWTVKKSYEKRRPEMDSAGFYGDTFSNGFGDFWTVKKRSTDEAVAAGKSDSVNNVGEMNPPLQTTQ